MSGAENGGDLSRKIDIPPTKEFAQVVTKVGQRMDSHITEALDRVGSWNTVQTLVQIPLSDFLSNDVTSQRLSWFRRAVRDHVGAVCSQAKIEAPTFEGDAPEGEIPSDYRYVGGLIDAVATVLDGKEDEQEIPGTQVDVTDTSQLGQRLNQMEADLRLLLGIPSTQLTEVRLFDDGHIVKMRTPTEWDKVDRIGTIQQDETKRSLSFSIGLPPVTQAQ